MSKACFVTGTDTGVGKTLVTAGLIHMLASAGLKVAGMKPVASGCDITAQGLRNDDALKLMQESNVRLNYDQVNPYAFETPVSPHFAACETGPRVNIDDIVENYSTISARSDFVFIEGVGGWRVPLNEDQDMSDLVVALNIPVVLVVGLRLGCINHALLTVESIYKKGLPLIACVASQIDLDYQRCDETLVTLEKRLGLPVQLVPWTENVQPVQLTHYLEKTIKYINETI